MTEERLDSIAVDEGGSIALEDVWGHYDLSREISAFFCIEDLLQLEKANLFFQEQLSETDPNEIWKQLESTTLEASVRPNWAENAKSHALLVHKASAFATTCENDIWGEDKYDDQDECDDQDELPLQEMGEDVAHEFFNISELTARRKQSCAKKSAAIFVRITRITQENYYSSLDEESDSQIIYQGFPSTCDLAGEFAPILYHRLMLYILNPTLGGKSTEYTEFLDLLDPPEEGRRTNSSPNNDGSLSFPSNSYFIVSVIAVQENGPSQLIRCAEIGPSTEPRCRGSVLHGTLGFSFFPTTPWSSNDYFNLNGVAYSLRCDVGLSYANILNTSSNTCPLHICLPFVSLSFKPVLDWENIRRDFLAANPEVAQQVENGLVTVSMKELENERVAVYIDPI